ncbi:MULTISPECIES: sigma-54-dependent transcriptional regulator [Treponema]|uniref:Two component, sigma54 specific, transcriptional regulator, Fis family n=1 Tax=Treponema saccharophilum DSM 2985 TaxID=907348 RepID=H7EPB0_9SPIR|nr:MULTISPECIES: sigma-54 dependent transcriptional regulator [Treponema]EIC00743.1 two component, sigma54 specific, transcriptional regulator, Fis family [Treponema saccharophilum DSM 2985]MBQ5537664.1 sigma-54-dependent Fis family transcriptional regulator [Treponema sp.]BDC95833.1 acetoacetate metabolism regulatory protein AtoC [Treponema saccharophilum]
MKFTILIVDDEKNIREGLAADFEMDGYAVRLAENGRDALGQISRGDIDLVITDLRMPGGVSGEDVLRHVTAETPGIPVIVLTGHGSIDAAVQAMHDGAYDFLTKPLNLEQLEMIVKRALEGRELSLKHQQLLSEVSSERGVDSVVGKSAAMQRVMMLVRKVADARISVLITGESGVGKNVVANAIHSLSARHDNALITVHCAALSESLLESELFGHEKGAFTGAESLHKGKFELAHGGTIFLDEIGEISQSVQVKLLRVLQERKFERVGGEQTIEVDVRIIAATNRNLEEEVKAGRFREDLFFRLNGIRIEVPPLRERKDDIPLLMNSFLTKFNKDNNKSIKGFDSRARTAIYKYDWPGNIRELEHCVESSVVMASGDEITVDDLPPTVSRASSSSVMSIPLGITLSEAERIVIEQNLAANKGNKSKTADILGIGRKTLHRKLSEYGLDD